MKEIYQNVYLDERYLYTKALVHGQVYGERIVKEKGIEYRNWDPFRSKLAAAMKNGLKTFPFKKDAKVLYLGASTGTTVSHLSDVCTSGEIFAVEVSHHVGKILMELAEKRENIIPIIADARQPKEYEEVGQVDALYQDVAQPDQADILISNAKRFLKQGGIAMIAIKSQSIDVTKDPQVVCAEVVKKLETCFEVVEKIKIEPFDKDHLFVVLKYG
jgi:fibrillarin-like pre-rRNA processing protein